MLQFFMYVAFAISLEKEQIFSIAMIPSCKKHFFLSLASYAVFFHIQSEINRKAHAFTLFLAKKGLPNWEHTNSNNADGKEQELSWNY